MNMEVVQKIKRIDRKYLNDLVKVHYNNALSKRYQQHIYSLYNCENRQIGHCINLKLFNVTFEINEKLKKECLETGLMNLHAYAKGTLLIFNSLNVEKVKKCYKEITYNPFSCLGFHFKNTKTEVKKSRILVLNQKGFFIFP